MFAHIIAKQRAHLLSLVVQELARAEEVVYREDINLISNAILDGKVFA